METEIQKYQRWLDGKEKAKKMWFEKYHSVVGERDRFRNLWKRANKRLHLTALAAGLTGVVVGFAIGVEFTLYKVFGGR